MGAQKKIRVSTERLRRMDAVMGDAQTRMQQLTEHARAASEKAIEHEEISRRLFTLLAALVDRMPERALLIRKEEIEALHAQQERWTLQQERTEAGVLLRRVELPEPEPQPDPADDIRVWPRPTDSP